MNKTAQHKKAVIEALEQSLGIVSEACKKVGVGRTTFYKWTREDSEFKEQVDDIEDVALDYVESQLYGQIRKGDTTAIIFYMKTKGKKRGYIEKTQHEHSGEMRIGPPRTLAELYDEERNTESES